MVRLLGSGSEGLEGAARALWILALNHAAIAAAGAIPPLVRMVGTGSADIQEEAARALIILAVDNHANQAAIGAAGGILPLVRLRGSGSASLQSGAARTAIRNLLLTAVETGEVGMVGELLASGQLQELIDDPTGALLLAAVGRRMADAPSMVVLLLRHGVPVTLRAVNLAVSRLNDEALEVLLTADGSPVPLGSEERPERWRGDGEHCPLYNLLTCQPPLGARARTAELLLAAGYRPAIYHNLVFSSREQEDEVVAHLCDFCPVEDLVAAQPALRTRLRNADRCVPVTMASVN